MRLFELIGEAAGVGKIEPGINTTPDIHPGEIKRQAAKLHWTVDDNGCPPIARTNGEIR
jgi:hypothetical protein